MLLAVLSALTLLATLAGGVVMGGLVETAIAVRHRESYEALYAADGALEGARALLAAAPDWAAWSTPEWRRLLQGTWAEMAGVDGLPPIHVEVWALADPGAEPGVLSLRAEARGRAGLRRRVLATVVRADDGVRLTAWQELR